MSDDERLKQTFDKLRAEDARRVPSFEAVQKKRRSKVSFLAVAVPLVTVAAALFLVLRSSMLTGGAAPASVAAGTPVAADAPAAQSEKASAVALVAAPPSQPVDEAPLDFLLDVHLLGGGAPDLDTRFLEGSIR